MAGNINNLRDQLSSMMQAGRMVVKNKLPKLTKVKAAPSIKRKGY
jgi:hypothetical protein